MRGENRKNRLVYRMQPCPAYDVEGMESWLGEMAGKGLFLVKDGFFAGIAGFEQGEPREARYRLQAAHKSTSMWAENSGEPDSEEVELGEKYGWSYIAKRGGFYIYRTFEDGARELNTDPQVQALALRSVQRRQASAVCTILFWLAAYLLILIRGGLLLAMLSAHTWLFLYGTVLALWFFADALGEWVLLAKMGRRLREEGTLGRHGSRSCRGRIYHVRSILQILLLLVFLGILLHNWSVSASGKDKVRLEDYHGNPPFATILDLAGEDAARYALITVIGKTDFSAVRQWQDWIAPCNMEWSEWAQVTFADGRVLEGLLQVNYHELRNAFLAEELAREYHRQDKRLKGYKEMALSVEDADFAAVYLNQLHIPTVLIQKGNMVVHASFRQMPGGFQLEDGEWMNALAESLCPCAKGVN